jgi:5-methylcytosine-specific restriction endonuclease McrA
MRPKGIFPSLEARHNMSVAQLGRKHSAETREKIRRAHLGRKFSRNHCRNISLAKQNISMETRMKISRAMTGRKYSQDRIERMRLVKFTRQWRANLSKGHLGHTVSAEQRLKVGLANRGQRRTSEVREQMRKSAIKRWRKVIPNYEPYAGKSRRNLKLIENGGHHTPADWEALKAKYDFKCLGCGKQEPVIKLTRDHIIPCDKGGNNDIENIQPLCQSCNSTKRTKVIRYLGACVTVRGE